MKIQLKKTTEQLPKTINRVGLGKAGNNAIQLLIARNTVDFEKEATQLLYKHLSKLIYKLDNDMEQELLRGE